MKSREKRIREMRSRRALVSWHSPEVRLRGVPNTYNPSWYPREDEGEGDIEYD